MEAIASKMNRYTLWIENDSSTLSHHALVALAVRCARRVQPICAVRDNRDGQLALSCSAAIERAIAAAEAFASGHAVTPSGRTTGVQAMNVFKDASDAALAAARTFAEAPKRAAALSACHAAACAYEGADEYDVAPNAHIEACAHAVESYRQSLDSIRLIQGDLESFKKASRHDFEWLRGHDGEFVRAEYPGKPIMPNSVGPLWPDTPPKWFVNPWEILFSTSDILLNAQIVLLGEDTYDGPLIQAVATPWFEILRQIERDPSFLHSIDWRQLEELIAGAYKRSGCPEVILTPRSADLGRDVIATWPGVGSVRIFDQVKAYAPNRVVTAQEVWALKGVVDGEGNVSKGIVTTTAKFAPGVYKDERLTRLIPHRLELKDGVQLRKWLIQIAAEGLRP